MKANETVTVLVLKDNHAARALKIQLPWIDRLGRYSILGVLIVIISTLFALYLGFFAIKSPLVTKHLESKIKALETEIHAKDLTIESLKPKAQTGTVASQPGFTLPFVRVGNLPSEESLVFKTKDGEAVWGPGSKLAVKLNLEVTTEGARQDGTLLAIVRGTGAYQVFPQAALTENGNAENQTLLDPKKGESFSVSRFRAFQADFSLPTDSVPQEAWVFIFNTEAQLIKMVSIKVPAKPLQRAPKPKETPNDVADPANSGSHP